MQKNKTTASRETEVALVIRSRDAVKIAKRIAALRALGAYRLEPRPTQKIRDAYFDTRAQSLQKQKLALRIRDLNGKALLALKGPSLPKANGARERMEIETAWSRDALARVLHELDARGIEIEMSLRDFTHDDPAATLARLGFCIIQERTTRRQVRHVIPRDASSKIVYAELAIDAVTFRFGGQRVHLHEIEIEAKGTPTRLGDLVCHLETMFYPTLRLWHGKLATGRAIQALLEKGMLQKLLDDRDHLTPKAYDRIARILK